MIYERENRFKKSAENKGFKSRFSEGFYEWCFWRLKNAFLIRNEKKRLTAAYYQLDGTSRHHISN